MTPQHKKIAEMKKEEYRTNLEDVRCPVCNNPKNWIKSVGNYHYNGEVVLLAECWSGDVAIDSPRHVFLIKLTDIPIVEVKPTH